MIELKSKWKSKKAFWKWKSWTSKSYWTNIKQAYSMKQANIKGCIQYIQRSNHHDERFEFDSSSVCAHHDKQSKAKQTFNQEIWIWDFEYKISSHSTSFNHTKDISTSFKIQTNNISL